MKVAFIYNPYHILIIYGLIKSGVKFKRILLPEKLETLTKKILADETIELVFMGTSFVSEGFLKRFLVIVGNFRLFKKLKCNELFIANDQSIIFLIAVKVFDIRSVTLIDEGALEQLILRERVSSRGPVYYVKKILLSCRSRGNHKKISKLIVHEPSQPLWDEFRTNHEILDGANLMDLALKNIFTNIPKAKLKNKFVIATSPLTENGNSTYENQEKDIIQNLLNNNPETFFILKTHYREMSDKYIDLISRYKNIELMEQVLNELPIQILFSEIENLIGFHSSVVTQFGNFFPGKAHSLSDFVGSDHSQKFVMTQPNGVIFLTKLRL